MLHFPSPPTPRAQPTPREKGGGVRPEEPSGFNRGRCAVPPSAALTRAITLTSRRAFLRPRGLPPIYRLLREQRCFLPLPEGTGSLTGTGNAAPVLAAQHSSHAGASQLNRAGVKPTEAPPPGKARVLVVLPKDSFSSDEPILSSRAVGRCAALTRTRASPRTFPLAQGVDWELPARRHRGFHRLRVSAPALPQTAHAMAAPSHSMPTAYVGVLKRPQRLWLAGISLSPFTLRHQGPGPRPDAADRVLTRCPPSPSPTCKTTMRVHNLFFSPHGSSASHRDSETLQGHVGLRCFRLLLDRRTIPTATTRSVRSAHGIHGTVSVSLKPNALRFHTPLRQRL